MAKIIEECHATKRATHEAFRSMVEQKRRRGITLFSNVYIFVFRIKITKKNKISVSRRDQRRVAPIAAYGGQAEGRGRA